MTDSKDARLTVRIDNDLHNWVKLYAQRVNKSMSDLVIAYLQSLQKGKESIADMDSSESNLEEQLKRADSEILHLREQLARRDEQIDQAQQLMAMQTKNVAVLTEQLESSRLMIEDLRHRPPWWKRVLSRK